MRKKRRSGGREAIAVPVSPRPWRMPLLIFLLLAVVTASWAAGWWGEVALGQARRNMTARNEIMAENWLRVAGRLNAAADRIAFLEARLHRRRNDLESMEASLRRAVAAGLELDFAERERALAAAQTGRLAEVADQLNRWMLSPGEDVADLADAMSLGLEAAGRLFEAKVILQAKKWDGRENGTGVPDTFSTPLLKMSGKYVAAGVIKRTDASFFANSRLVSG